jgi:hypothetical protein
MRASRSAWAPIAAEAPGIGMAIGALGSTIVMAMLAFSMSRKNSRSPDGHVVADKNLILKGS